MATPMDFDQEVISNNKDIFARIAYELEIAQSEIFIATSWFTDDVLYGILLEKAEAGVKIELIVADNQENERLDFAALQAKGALVIKIKNVGYGIMHQKFCVIDRRLALHGSYNWSNNAKNNNHESIIVTNHKQTVESLLNTFLDIRNRASGILNDEPFEREIQPQATKKEFVMNTTLKIKEEYEDLLGDMIAAETATFDPLKIREEGHSKAKANNGSSMVIAQSMDIIYAKFIDDIDVTEDEKLHMLSKIKDQEVKFSDRLKKNSEVDIELLEKEHQKEESQLASGKIKIEADIDLCVHQIKSIEENGIPFILQKIELLDQEIKSTEREFIKPKFKFHELLPSLSLAFILLIYVIVFYSSAVYILIYVEKDAAEARANHVHNYTPPQVFYPAAYQKAYEKGGLALPFIILFPFVLLALANVPKMVDVGEFWKKWGILPIIIVIDSFIAYTVAHSLYSAKYLIGADDAKAPWNFWMAFTESNFYLVFILGALGLLMFKFAYEKFITAFEERSPNLEAQRNQMKIKHLQEKIAEHKEQIITYRSEIGTIEGQLISHKAELKGIEIEQRQLASLFDPRIAANRSALTEDLKSIQKVTDLYIAYVETNKVPVSKRALLSRIGEFLSGWNDYLHEYFSVSRANTTYAEVLAVVEQWQKNKFDNGNFDQRITE